MFAQTPSKFICLRRRACGILMTVIFLSTLADLKAESETSGLAQFKSPGCVFTGDFNQSKTISGLDQELLSSGHFFYHCRKGVVWKTTNPIEEALVFTKGGMQFRIEGEKRQIVKSPRSRMLGELMNGLIGWQRDYIESNFSLEETWSSSASQGLSLLPSKRSLKRALTKVDLNLVQASGIDSVAGMKIAMLDNNSQWIRIEASAIKIYYQVESGDIALENDLPEVCSSIGKFSDLECTSLDAYPLIFPP